VQNTTYFRKSPDKKAVDKKTASLAINKNCPPIGFLCLIRKNKKG